MCLPYRVIDMNCRGLKPACEVGMMTLLEHGVKLGYTLSSIVHYQPLKPLQSCHPNCKMTIDFSDPPFSLPSFICGSTCRNYN